MSRRRPAALLALLAAGGAAAVLILAGGSPSKPRPASDTTSGAARVERRDLVATDTEAGTLGYTDPQTVYDRLSGTITWLPRVGQTIKAGGVLFRVDGRPVVLMDGATPAYRGLAPGTGAGGDVLQLNRDLVDLGFEPETIAIDDEWQAGTTAGVEQLQRSLGEAQTGKLALGQVVFLPGTQLVTTVDATLGGDGAGSGSANPSSAGNASDLGGHTGRREYASLEAPAAPTAKHRAPAAKRSAKVRSLEAQVARVQAEVDRLRSQRTPGPTNPSGSTGAREPAGSGGTSPTPILATTSTRIVVKVSLEASKQGEASVGGAVTVALPDGESVGGTVTAVSTVAQSSTETPPAESGGGGSGGSTSTVPVTIVLHHRPPGAGLDQAQVSVEFVRAVARKVLSVPVTALLATGPGGYAVQEASPPHRLIPVATGLFAAGDVQVSGAGVRPGLLVSDSQG